MCKQADDVRVVFFFFWHIADVARLFGCFVLHANFSLIRITVPCLRAPDGETRKETPERLEKAITGYVNSPFCLSFLGSSEMGTFFTSAPALTASVWRGARVVC